MKKLGLLFAGLMIVLGISAQNEPYKIFSMEDVTRVGKNCDYDPDTRTAVFKDKWDRWFDVPSMQGDFSEHSKIQFDVLESNVILKVVLRYRGEDGKTKEATIGTLYGQMGKVISSKKTIKLDLKGKEGEFAEALKSLVGLRISMGKVCDGVEEGEEWKCVFGSQFIVK